MIYDNSNQLMHNKLKYAQTIHTMIDNFVRPNYELESEMPVI